MTTSTSRKYHQSLLASVALIATDVRNMVPGTAYGAKMFALHALDTHVPAEHRKDAITAFEDLRTAVTEADRETPIENVTLILSDIDKTVESIEAQVGQQNGAGDAHVEPAAAAQSVEQAGTDARAD